MTTKAAAAKAAKPPALEAEALYRVSVSERFRFRGVGFGTIAETEVRGALLGDLLADPEHGPRVASYAAVEAPAPVAAEG